MILFAFIARMGLNFRFFSFDNCFWIKTEDLSNLLSHFFSDLLNCVTPDFLGIYLTTWDPTFLTPTVLIRFNKAN